MLQTIHDKLKGWLAGVVLGAIGLVFVFWGINWTLSAPTYAAKVNGIEIRPTTCGRPISASSRNTSAKPTRRWTTPSATPSRRGCWRTSSMARRSPRARTSSATG